MCSMLFAMCMRDVRAEERIVALIWFWAKKWQLVHATARHVYVLEAYGRACALLTPMPCDSVCRLVRRSPHPKPDFRVSPSRAGLIGLEAGGHIEEMVEFDVVLHFVVITQVPAVYAI